MSISPRRSSRTRGSSARSAFARWGRSAYVIEPVKPIARRPSSPDAAALASSSAALAAARIAVRAVEQHLPRGQQLDAARRAPQQRRPDVGLQAADELRERRLGHVQPGRGAAEVQLLPDRDERVQLPDLHVTKIMQFRV